MGTLGRTIEQRALGTMKINPNLSYNEALQMVLRSEGVIIALSLSTPDDDVPRSVEAKQSDKPPRPMK